LAVFSLIPEGIVRTSMEFLRTKTCPGEIKRILWENTDVSNKHNYFVGWVS